MLTFLRNPLKDNCFWVCCHSLRMFASPPLNSVLKCFLSATLSPFNWWSFSSSLVSDTLPSKSTSNGGEREVLFSGDNSGEHVPMLLPLSPSSFPLTIVAIVGSACSLFKVAFTSSWIGAGAVGGRPGRRGPLSTLSRSARPPLPLPHPACSSSSAHQRLASSTYLLPSASWAQSLNGLLFRWSYFGC